MELEGEGMGGMFTGTRAANRAMGGRDGPHVISAPRSPKAPRLVEKLLVVMVGGGEGVGRGGEGSGEACICIGSTCSPDYFSSFGCLCI